MTSTSWFKLFGIGACVAFAAAACTVSSGEGEEDDDITTNTGGSGGGGGTGGDGGSGGSTTSSNTTSNTTSTTSSTTSTSSTTGSGGATDPVDCLDEEDSELGTVATCEFEEGEADCCDKCIAAKCCEEYSECFAYDPNNICGGTAEGQGADSEIYAFMSCMLDIDGVFPGTDEGSDFDGCIGEATANVSDVVCGNGTISGPTNDLATCIAGDQDGLDGCFTECLDKNFNTECLY